MDNNPTLSRVLEALKAVHASIKAADECWSIEGKGAYLDSAKAYVQQAITDLEAMENNEGETAEEIYAKIVKSCKLLGIEPPLPPSTNTQGEE